MGIESILVLFTSVTSILIYVSKRYISVGLNEIMRMCIEIFFVYCIGYFISTQFRELFNELSFRRIILIVICFVSYFGLREAFVEHYMKNYCENNTIAFKRKIKRKMRDIKKNFELLQKDLSLNVEKQFVKKPVDHIWKAKLVETLALLKSLEVNSLENTIQEVEEFVNVESQDFEKYTYEQWNAIRSKIGHLKWSNEIILDVRELINSCLDFALGCAIVLGGITETASPTQWLVFGLVSTSLIVLVLFENADRSIVQVLYDKADGHLEMELLYNAKYTNNGIRGYSYIEAYEVTINKERIIKINRNYDIFNAHEEAMLHRVNKMLNMQNGKGNKNVQKNYETENHACELVE